VSRTSALLKKVVAAPRHRGATSSSQGAPRRPSRLIHLAGCPSSAVLTRFTGPEGSSTLQDALHPSC
jgi:hypothetical protein